MAEHAMPWRLRLRVARAAKPHALALLSAAALAWGLGVATARAESPSSPPGGASFPRYGRSSGSGAPSFRERLARRDERNEAPAFVANAPEALPAGEPEYSFEGYDGAQIETAAPGEIYTEGPYPDGPVPDGPVPDGPYIDGPYPGGPYMDGQYCETCGGVTCAGGCGGFDWSRLYVRADYLLWWGKGFWAPPLVTTSIEGTPRDDAGVLGLDSTSVLFPYGNLADTIQSGGRIRLGYWFDPCETVALEGTYFALAGSSTHYNASGEEIPILARPFVNIAVDGAANDSELVAYPDLFSGSISVIGKSRLQGADVILRHAICRGCDWRVDWLAGWRFNRLDESLVVSDEKEALSTQTGLVVGTVLSEYDRFSSTNYFNGGQVGIITELRRCRWWFETRTILALGNTHSIVDIEGQATSVVPTPGGVPVTTVTPAGLLAQSTNIGQYTEDAFAVVPQIGFNFGYEVCCGLWATVGYNFMYWSRVLRPGDQIDTDINLSQLSDTGLEGLPRPEYLDIATDYWAQGFNFGLAYRF